MHNERCTPGSEGGARKPAGVRPARRRAPTLPLGAEIAARSGLAFLARIPEDFRGRIQPAERAGPTCAYAVVSDGERFVVLRSTPALRALQGQSVAVARDAKGRLVVRPDPNKDIER